MKTTAAIKDIESLDINSACLLDLYANGALLYDPHQIGKCLWPNQANMPADINLELTNFFYLLLAEAGKNSITQVLRALYGMTGALSFNLSFYNLSLNADKISGLYCDKAKPFITCAARTKPLMPTFKDKIVINGQKFLLQFFSMLGVVPKLTISKNSIYLQKDFGKIWRVRRPESVSFVYHYDLSKEEIQETKNLAVRILKKFLDIANKYQIIIDGSTINLYEQYIFDEIASAFCALKSYRSFFGGHKFDFYERSLTPYHKALIAIVCHENGGRAHSTYHGVCQSASEPDVATMANSSVFWGVTQAFTDDAHELSLKLPEGLRTYEILNMGQEQHYKAFVRQDSVRSKIKRVAIMGRQVVMRYSAFNSLEFPAYLDFERKMSNFLLQEGYEVIYKAHPESQWRHFDKFLDPRVVVDWRSFEQVMDDFDAVLYHFAASSTLPHALGSNLHVFMLQDGWHDVRIWPTRLQKFYQEYCNMLQASVGQDGLINLDFAAVSCAFKQPKKFNSEQRINNFFCKRYQ